jgi:hypothetical protein
MGSVLGVRPGIRLGTRVHPSASRRSSVDDYGAGCRVSNPRVEGFFLTAAGAKGGQPKAPLEPLGSDCPFQPSRRLHLGEVGSRWAGKMGSDLGVRLAARPR